jgi:hypothetical protein
LLERDELPDADELLDDDFESLELDVLLDSLLESDDFDEDDDPDELEEPFFLESVA